MRVISKMIYQVEQVKQYTIMEMNIMDYFTKGKEMEEVI